MCIKGVFPFGAILGAFSFKIAKRDLKLSNSVYVGTEKTLLFIQSSPLKNLQNGSCKKGLLTKREKMEFNTSIADCFLPGLG
jgi:hypothetical protein